MQVTRAVDYGVRALVLMARQSAGTRFYLQQLSEQANLPRNYLVKVLKSLASNGIVRSFRGIKGGFSLACEPEKISLRMVVEAIDGPVSIISCLTDTHSNGCQCKGRCAAQRRFAAIREAVLRQLAACSIRDLVVVQTEIEQQPRARGESAKAAAVRARG